MARNWYAYNQERARKAREAAEAAEKARIDAEIVATYYSYKIQPLPESLVEFAAANYMKPRIWQMMIGMYYSGQIPEDKFLAGCESAKADVYKHQAAIIAGVARECKLDEAELTVKVTENLSIEDFLDCLHDAYGDTEDGASILDNWTYLYKQLCLHIASRLTEDRRQAAYKAKVDALKARGLQICDRCGGVGGSEAWRHTGWNCFECDGRGYVRIDETEDEAEDEQEPVEAGA